MESTKNVFPLSLFYDALNIEELLKISILEESDVRL